MRSDPRPLPARPALPPLRELHTGYRNTVAWARAAIEEIDAKRSEFVDSLNVRETALLARIDDAFTRTINANATAYLKSLLKVEEMQDRVLQATGLSGGRTASVSPKPSHHPLTG